MKEQQGICPVRSFERRKLIEDGFQVEVGLDFTNNRLKVLSCQVRDYFEMAERIKKIARQKDLSKIIFNSRQEGSLGLERAGFLLEGTIPKFFQGKEAYCYSYFLEPNRAQSPYLKEEDDILSEVTGDLAAGKGERLCRRGIIYGRFGKMM
ncbi:hypothetical protein N752_04950 [Desulforamulus aquiferis]|nr:hypothetical protein [Desulforamulus aquiferis]RYD06241.1 hypothetical protein N752_04950 [Desulforamulus aquiferis]